MSRSGPLTRDTSTIALGLAQIRVGNAASNVATITPVLTSSASIGALASTKFTSTVNYWKLVSGFPQLEDMSIPLSEEAKLECAFKEITPYNLALARGIDPGGAQVATATSISKNTTLGTVDATKPITVTQDAGPVTDRFIVSFTSATAFTVIGEVTGEIGSGVVGSEYAPDNPLNTGHAFFTIPANHFAGTWADGDSAVFETVAYIAAGSYANAHSGSIGLGAMVAPAFVRMEAVYTYPNGTNHMYIIFPRANATASTELDMQAADAASSPITFEAKRADSDTSGGDVAWNSMPLGRLLFD